MTKLDNKWFDAKTGVLSFRLKKPDGGWHRITLMPGDDIDYILKCNNAHLESMGHTKIDVDHEANIRAIVKEEHTEEVVTIFKAKVAAEAAKVR